MLAPSQLPSTPSIQLAKHLNQVAGGNGSFNKLEADTSRVGEVGMGSESMKTRAVNLKHMEIYKVQYMGGEYSDTKNFLGP